MLSVTQNLFLIPLLALCADSVALHRDFDGGL